MALDSLADLLWFGIFSGKSGMWTRQWTLADGRRVTLLEDTHSEGDEGECTIWPAGLVLGRYLESQHADIAGQVVVELGAGAAVGAITAAALGAEAYATEHPDAMEYTMACLGANPAFLAGSGEAGPVLVSSESGPCRIGARRAGTPTRSQSL